MPARDQPGGARRSCRDAGRALGHVLPLDDPSAWRWGVRTAQRVVQLELDILRAALLDTQTEAAADAIFADAVRSTRRSPSSRSSGRPSRCGRRGRSRGARLARPRRLRVTARSRSLARFGRCSSGSPRLGQGGDNGPARNLASSPSSARRLTEPPCSRRFEPAAQQNRPSAEAELSEEAFQAFVARALEVEVIRRSFADDLDIESAQTLHVAQIRRRSSARCSTWAARPALGLRPVTRRRKPSARRRRRQAVGSG
jgi:hypothetical protein